MVHCEYTKVEQRFIKQDTTFFGHDLVKKYLQSYTYFGFIFLFHFSAWLSKVFLPIFLTIPTCLLHAVRVLASKYFIVWIHKCSKITRWASKRNGEFEEKNVSLPYLRNSLFPLDITLPLFETLGKK